MTTSKTISFNPYFSIISVLAPMYKGRFPGITIGGEFVAEMDLTNGWAHAEHVQRPSFLCAMYGLPQKQYRLRSARESSYENVIAGVRARSDPEPTIDEQQREENTGKKAKEETEPLECFAVVADVMRGRKK